MKTSNQARLSDRLLIKSTLTPVYATSLIIALVMTVASTAGLLFGGDIYVTDELIRSFVPVDILNLVVGLPILLASMWLARRGKLMGLLCWPGILLYVLYSYLSVLTAVPFGVMFLPYLSVVTLSAYTIIGLVATIDGEAVRQRLRGFVPAKVAGGILAVVTLLFVILDASAIVSALLSHPPIEPEHPPYVLIADFIIIPACLIGGLLLWRRERLGYVVGAGLLLFYSILLIGPIPILVYAALADGTPIPVGDIIFLLVIALICLIPFGLFARGVVRSRSSSYVD